MMLRIVERSVCGLFAMCRVICKEYYVRLGGGGGLFILLLENGTGLQCTLGEDTIQKSDV